MEENKPDDIKKRIGILTEEQVDDMLTGLKKEEDLMVHVLYHSNCYDGFGAAFSAWKKFGDKAKYIPVSYGQPIPELSKATDVYILDFSYSETELLEIARKHKLTLLDHHKTAEETLKHFEHPNAEIIFNMNKSGALLAWEYFHENSHAPLLIQYISDRDLWKFELEDTHKIHKALVSYPMDFKVWDNFDINELKHQGETCDRLYTQLVSNIIQKAWMEDVGGYMVPVVNTSIAWSEVGHELAKRNPNSPFVASFTMMKSSVMWSLRSIGDFDVSEVAKRFGGGGHKNAAGFKEERE